MSGDFTFVDWYNTILTGQVARKTVTLIYKNTEGVELSRYTMEYAWPVRLDSGLTETVEITSESLTRVVTQN